MAQTEKQILALSIQLVLQPDPPPTFFSGQKHVFLYFKSLFPSLFELHRCRLMFLCTGDDYVTLLFFIKMPRERKTERERERKRAEREGENVKEKWCNLAVRKFE